MGLNGIINGTAIPSSVTRLYLHVNAITGSIPSALPSGLISLSLDGNQMSGDLPSFPSSLQYFYLGYPGFPGNHFTGTLRLNRPIELYINDNWITDVVIQNSSVLGTCDLSNNPLLENPNIAGLTTCTKSGLYSASLLPITRSTLTTLTKTTTTSALTTMSISEATTQLVTATLEKTNVATVMTLETTMKVTATKRSTNIGYSTVQQRSSNEIASGTQAFTLTSSMGTVQFVQEMRGIVVNLGMMLRCIVSTMILSVVFVKTPFKREFKRMRKRKTTKTTSGLEF